MDDVRFDALSRAIAGSGPRRSALRILVGGGIGGLAAMLGVREAAACRRAGRPCKRDKQCCGRNCRRGECRATRKGSCRAGQDACIQGQVGEALCNGGQNSSCYCFRDVDGRAFCGRGGICDPCTTNQECDAVTGVEGSACIPQAGTFCNCSGGAPSCHPPCQVA